MCELICIFILKLQQMTAMNGCEQAPLPITSQHREEKVRNDDVHILYSFNIFNATY